MKTLFLVLTFALALSGCGRNKLDIGPQGPLNSNMNEVKEMNAEGLVRMAQNLEQSGDYASAMQFYLDALNRDPNMLAAHLGLARLLEAIGNSARAANYYANALKLDPASHEAAMGAARNLINASRPIDATSVINEYMQENPATPGLLNQFGVALDLTANHRGAQEAYRTGLAQVAAGDGLQVILLSNLALSLGLSGSYSEAVLLLNPHIGDMRTGASGITRAQSLLRQNLALVYALSGKPDSAVEVAASALGMETAEYNRAFYEVIPSLDGYEQARAVFFGTLPDNIS